MKHSQRLFPLLTLMLSLILPGCLLPGDANAAEQGVAINYIHGEGQANGIKLAYQLYLDTLKPISEDLELTLEASINFWEYGEDNQHDVNHVLAMSPILRYPLTRGNGWTFISRPGSALPSWMTANLPVRMSAHTISLKTDWALPSNLVVSANRLSPSPTCIIPMPASASPTQGSTLSTWPTATASNTLLGSRANQFTG